MSSTIQDPNAKPPSYSLLGILLAVRLAYRLYTLLSPLVPSPTSLFTSNTESENTSAQDVQLQKQQEKETFVDGESISSLVPPFIGPADAGGQDDDGKDFWGDRTVLDLDANEATASEAEKEIVGEIHASRKCALCLEERTASSVTECGHVFCWTCVVGWAREKVITIYLIMRL